MKENIENLSSSNRYLDSSTSDSSLVADGSFNNEKNNSSSNISIIRHSSYELSGLYNGKKLGILATGYLEKRRDGAVRGGWAKRFFVLSISALHYFRKAYPSELFGEERGHIQLKEIVIANIVDSKDAPNGSIDPEFDFCFISILTNEKSKKFFLRAPDLSLAKEWTKAINHAIFIAKRNDFTNLEWTDEYHEEFINYIKGGSITSNKDIHINTIIPVVPEIAVISIRQPNQKESNMEPKKFTEELLCRFPQKSIQIFVGSMNEKKSLIITLTNHRSLIISYNSLLDSSKTQGRDRPSPLKLTSSVSQDFNVELTVSVISSQVTSKISKSLNIIKDTGSDEHHSLSTFSKRSSTEANNPGAFTLPVGLSFIFLLSFITSCYSNSNPFQGLMKFLLLIGLILSAARIVQFLHGLYELKTNISLTSNLKEGADKHDKHLITDIFQFWITIESIEVVSVENTITETIYTDENIVQNKICSSQIDANNESIIQGNHNENKKMKGNQDMEINEIKDNIYKKFYLLETTDYECIPYNIDLKLVPKRFMDAEKGDYDKGKDRFLKTLEWRKENNINSILIRPHFNFKKVKKYYPQFFHGRSKSKNPVYYELPGQIDLVGLKNEGLSMKDLLYHYMYITEYLWQKIEGDHYDIGKSITVLDVSGIGISDLGGEVLDFIRKASSFTGAHYPERSAHIYIINISSMFNFVWNMIKPMIDPVTRDKVHMVRNKYIIDELTKYIDLNEIPSNYGGNSTALGESIEEKQLKEHVFQYLNES